MPEPYSRQSSLTAAIYNTVRSIPSGRVANYGRVALAAGLPGQARLVGYALHRLPDDSDVPWHRVVNVRGDSRNMSSTARCVVVISADSAWDSAIMRERWA